MSQIHTHIDVLQMPFTQSPRHIRSNAEDTSAI